jgi:hypothetical protein
LFQIVFYDDKSREKGAWRFEKVGLHKRSCGKAQDIEQSCNSC